MGLSCGMIKLSYCQAESSSINAAALCLKYITAIGVSVAVFVMWLRNHDDNEGAALLGCSAVAVLTAVYLRASFMQKMYEISSHYLRTEGEISPIKPNFAQLFGFGMALLAVKCVVWLVMLLPAAFCLRTGAVSYSLSGEREQFMLMLNAALCLAASGVIFASIVLARFGCAEYLFFSGECESVFSALDCSWLITRGAGGDMLTIRLLPSLHGVHIAALSRLNLAEKLAGEYVGRSASKELYVVLLPDGRGEQRFDLMILN